MGTGLKPLKHFRLKGVLKYGNSLLLFLSGTHEIRKMFVETSHSCILPEFLSS
jgi:hypothetical protein